LIQEIRLANRPLTLRRRRDVHFASRAEERGAENAGREFLAGSFDWMRDQAFMSKLKELLSIDETDPAHVRGKVQRAFELGEVVTIPDRPSSGGLSGARDGDAPRPRSTTFTPSQLFKGAPRITRTGSYYDRPTQPRLFADDCMAAWLAKPGDLLSDGGGEAMVDSFGDSGRDSSLLGDAQPFEYGPDEPTGEIDALAGMPFNGEPGTWISSMPGTMPQLRQYGPNGTPLTDFDLEAHHGNPNPHAHNWDGYRRDNGAPVSLLPW
jgi:hypothetical protein